MLGFRHHRRVGNGFIVAHHGSSSKLLLSRLALLPALPPALAATCLKALAEGGSDFLDFILHQDLGPLWHYCLQTGGMLDSLPAATADALRAARLSATANYLQQRAELERLDRLFADQGLPYLVMKGAHVRECVYPDPALRLAGDIDILVLPQDRRRAAELLLKAGFTAHIEPNNISHEATFSRNGVDIDLHWHMLRPSRMRVGMTDGFLARRQRENGIWRLSDADTLFFMLTHPAFAKYICSPNMGLGRVADFLLWIQQKKTDWPAVLQLLEQAGLKTAAWIMLSWFRTLGQSEAANDIDRWLDTLRPGRLRTAYLQAWLAHDLPSRWLTTRPLLIQLGLTLALHDRPADAWHALKGILLARKNHLHDARLLLGETGLTRAGTA